MATVARRTSGTFSSEYDEIGVYTLTRVVAEFVAPDEPTLVTMRPGPSTFWPCSC